MLASRRLILFIVFIAVPLVEIAVLIKVGQLIGVLLTILIIIGTAILGLFVMRGTGFGMITRASQAVAAGRTPVEPVVDGAFLMFAGLLLISPGLVADTIGLMLLVPPLRQLIARVLVGGLAKSGNLHVTVFGQRGPKAKGDGPPGAAEPEEGTIIDGEFKRLDDREPRDKPRR